MWQTVGRIAKGLDETSAEAAEGANGWTGDDTLAKEANGWASISMTTQKVVDALMESIEKGCPPVDV
jgi:hypothetical protein